MMCQLVIGWEFFLSTHVPRVAHPDYPSHPHLRNIPRDELASLFCEKAMVWGDTLNFSTIEFAKGPRILNMVMTFVLTPWSHYNTIIEPHAHFLLSLLQDFSIDFSYDSIYNRYLSRHCYT